MALVIPNQDCMIQCRNAPDCGYFSFFFPGKKLGWNKFGEKRHEKTSSFRKRWVHWQSPGWADYPKLQGRAIFLLPWQSKQLVVPWNKRGRDGGIKIDYMLGEVFGSIFQHFSNPIFFPQNFFKFKSCVVWGTQLLSLINIYQQPRPSHFYYWPKSPLPGVFLVISNKSISFSEATVSLRHWFCWRWCSLSSHHSTGEVGENHL